MSKKKIISIVIILIIIILTVSISIIYFKNRAKYVFDVEYVSAILYNQVKGDGKYGVVDESGTIII